MELDQGRRPAPEEFGDLYNSEAEILMFSGADPNFDLRRKLGLEFDDTPLKNDNLANDINGQLDLTHQIALIYITAFFKDSTDFVFFVKGLKNMTEFSKGTFARKAYLDPCFATPVIGFNIDEIFEQSEVLPNSFETVSRMETKGIRWRYYYESARVAWDQLQFDWPKVHQRALQRQAEEVEESTRLRASPSVEVPTSDTQGPETPPESPPGSPPEDLESRALTSMDEMEDIDGHEKDENDVNMKLGTVIESLDINREIL